TRASASIPACVANAANCEKLAWALAVHLSAKTRHVPVHKVGVRGVGVAPDVVEALHAGDDAALVAHEEFKKAEFLRTKIDDPAVPLCAAAAEVQHQPIDLELSWLAGLHLSAPERANARQKLLEGERLCEIVVGARI